VKVRKLPAGAFGPTEIVYCATKFSVSPVGMPLPFCQSSAVPGVLSTPAEVALPAIAKTPRGVVDVTAPAFVGEAGAQPLAVGVGVTMPSALSVKYGDSNCDEFTSTVRLFVTVMPCAAGATMETINPAMM
jgi:hypothetical protein